MTSPRPIVPDPNRPAPTQPKPGTPSPMNPPQRPPNRPLVADLLLAAPPKPSDPTQGPDRPWPGQPQYPNVAVMTSATDDMPLPRPNPGPPPPPTPKPGIWKRVALAGVLGTAVTVAATLVLANAIRRLNLAVPLNSSEWLIGLVAFIGLVSQFATPSRRRSKQASPSVPSGTALAVDAPLRQRAVRAGLPLLRPGRTWRHGSVRPLFPWG